MAPAANGFEKLFGELVSSFRELSVKIETLRLIVHVEAEYIVRVWSGPVDGISPVYALCRRFIYPLVFKLTDTVIRKRECRLPGRKGLLATTNILVSSVGSAMSFSVCMLFMVKLNTN
jgi:hypothetical protein